KQPRADGELVVLRPLAALREQSQFISLCDANFASPEALPDLPLLAAEGLPGQYLLARAADFHCVRLTQPAPGIAVKGDMEKGGKTSVSRGRRG
ncbi:hypothetical protein THAOC_26237, partial [Thalassiosira oceanica]